MLFTFLLVISISAFLVNSFLFFKIFPRISIRSIFNTSQSIYFLYVSIISPVIFLTYYFVISSKNELQILHMDSNNTELYQDTHALHRRNCWIYYFTRPLGKVPGIVFSFCSLVYRYLYVTMADRGFLVGGSDNLRLSNKLYFIFVFFLCTFQTSIYVSSAIKYDGTEQYMKQINRVCLLVGFDYSNLHPNVFKDSFVKPLFIKLVFLSLSSFFTIFCKVRVQTYTKAVCPDKKYSAFGGKYRRNFQTLSENFFFFQSIFIYILVGQCIHIGYYIMGDSLDKDLMFNSWMIYTFTFDLYTFLYLPAKWLHLSRSRYLSIWHQEPEHEKKPFYASKPIIVPRRDILCAHVIKRKRHRNIQIPIITITHPEGVEQRKRKILMTGHRLGESLQENDKRVKID